MGTRSEMRFVILLGALALLALSTTAENQDKAIDLARTDILIRDARDAEKKKERKKKNKSRGKKRTSRKKKKNYQRTRQSNRKEKGKGSGSKKGNGKATAKGRGNAKKNQGKGGKGMRRSKTRKGVKSVSPNRQTTNAYFNCPAFYNDLDTTAVRDFRYARNQISKAKRAKKRIEKLERLMSKAATAFSYGAAFYKDCSAIGASAVGEALSQCNVTAANACDPANLKNQQSYANLNNCIAALQTTLDSSDSCLQKGACNTTTCNYQSIGMVPGRHCDYIAFEKEVSDLLNSKCSNSTFVGSFTYCNNLLKDSYPIAARCECSPTLTTVAPTSARLRNNLNIWKI